MKTSRPQKPLKPKALIGLVVGIVLLVVCCCGKFFGDDEPKDTASSSSTSTAASLAPSPSPTRSASPKPKPSPSVYYADCDDVEAAGEAPLLEGEPGYRKALDANGDEIACNAADLGAGDSSDDGGDAYYANCSEARAAGAAPLHRGEPGYRKGLDRDGDGTACDR